MLKSILKVEGVQKLSKTQQLNISGGDEDLKGDNGVTCGISSQCPDGLDPFWAPGCEPGCQVGYCQDGNTVTRPCF